jgi:lipid A ethanolaminephosphotransferase
MLDGLDVHIRELTTDTAIVFHQIGSHGPAYWQRYPAAFERFKPSCRSNELHTCSEQQVINTYDNTVAYTDHILSRQIEILRSAAESVDSFLLYVSDHGESLGENGIYLHGIPYSFAPRVQKHVPMLMWASDGYVARTQLDTQCLRRRSADSISHDNLYHTLLGAAEVYDAVYQPKLDVLFECRGSNLGSE